MSKRTPTYPSACNAIMSSHAAPALFAPAAHHSMREIAPKSALGTPTCNEILRPRPPQSAPTTGAEGVPPRPQAALIAKPRLVRPAGRELFGHLDEEL